MDLGLEDRTAWVLGASSGLGLATARALAGEGADLAISARRGDVLQAAARDIETTCGVRCIPIPLDVADPRAITAASAQAVEKLGGLDVCVVNAGGPPPGPFESMGEEEMRAAFELTTASAWRVAQAVVPVMKARGRGVLIFLTSSSTKEVIPNLLLSNMMRAAVVGLAKTLSKELGPAKIRVLCVAPGRIETDRLRALDESTANRTGRTPEEVGEAAKANIPFRRYGTPDELGNVVAFLASDRASYVTGTTVVVDGGALNSL